MPLFSISSAQGSIKNISKSFFRVAMSFIKTIEFGNVKFPKSISSEDGVWREFLEIDSGSTFSKKWVVQKREL